MSPRTKSTTLILVAGLASAFGCTDSSHYARHASRRLAPYGLRVGALGFGDFDKVAMSNAVSLGYYHRLGTRGSEIYEIAADAAMRTEGGSDWQFYMVGGTVIFLPAKRERFYLHAGGGAMNESLPNSSYTAGYASAGCGYSLAALGTALDLRLTGYAILESENAGSAYGFTVGYGF